MNKKSVFSGLFIALFCLSVFNSIGQLYTPANNKSLKGTAKALWDAANNRYLIAYQDMSKDLMGVLTYKSKIYQCGRGGKDTTFFTDLGGQLKAPSGMFISGTKLYICDWTKIWVVNLSDGTILDQILAPGKARFQDICSDGGNRMYATDNADNKIYWFDLTTKLYDTLAVDTNGVKGPTGIYYEASPVKCIYICSFISGSPIQRFDFTGDSANKFYRLKSTSYKFCYGFTGDNKGNYYISEWLSTAPAAGSVYKFKHGFDTAVVLKDLLNFPAGIIYQPIGDTVVIPELNSSTKIMKMIGADRDFAGPRCDTAITIDPTHIKVYFNEPVNATSTMAVNYSGVGNNITAALDATKTIVTLTLGTALVKKVKTTLSITNVQDLAKNPMQPRSVEVTYNPVGIEDNFLKSGLSVYPNPVKNKLNIDYDLLQTANASIELYDMMGQKVADFYTGNQTAGKYQLSYQLPKSVATNGIYILKVMLNEQIIMTKVIVNR